MTYELIVPSASRPHCLSPVLDAIIEHVDLKPSRLILHDDAAFPNRQDAIRNVIAMWSLRTGIPYDACFQNPPIYHGPALKWLLDRVTTDFVLYVQDDQKPIRSLPIRQTLDLMREYGLNQVRFNKRATMEWKMTYRKLEVDFGGIVCCVADHWYFQLGLWRVAQVKPIVDWWMETSSAFHEHAEIKVNRTMNGQSIDFAHPTVRLPPPGTDPMSPEVRRDYQRTYIWGPIGEARFFDNLAVDPSDWALPHARGGVGIRETFE